MRVFGLFLWYCYYGVFLIVVFVELFFVVWDRRVGSCFCCFYCSR